jgi:hypothetical protein
VNRRTPIQELCVYSASVCFLSEQNRTCSAGSLRCRSGYDDTHAADSDRLELFHPKIIIITARNGCHRIDFSGL